ncbi:MAG: DUF58 domain-containing protein [Planctomycetota bacterium]|jgi:uncharacterized protein (DUF58 family)
MFEPGFLESLAGLRIVARRVPRHGRHAEQRSADMGGGNEFRDYRDYAAGDDLRYVDWNVYRRLRHVVLRLFEELEDLPHYILPDISDSMWAEDPPRAVPALKATLALASISLTQHDRVGVYPFGEDLLDRRRPKAGKGRVLSLATELAKLEHAGGTNLAGAIDAMRSLRLRPGLLTVVSDFFDPQGLDAVLASLKQCRHRLLLIQVVRATDREPVLVGDVRVRDCETGAAEDITITPAVVDRYKAAYTAFESTLADFAMERNAGLLRLDADGDVVAQLATLFEGGSYRL